MSDVKIPYPGDLNSIDTAVWGAEYVRARESFRSAGKGPVRNDEVDMAIKSANEAVADIRSARDRHDK